MPVDLYYIPESPSCIGVILAAKAIGVELNLIELDKQKSENLTPAFLKMNPQHTIPTIVDDGFALWESRAINMYLQNEYGRDDTLYPKVPKQRALVDQRLQFDLGTLYPALTECYFMATFLGLNYEKQKIEKVNNALKVFDAILERSVFSAGDNFTLADISLVVTISYIELFGHDLTPFLNIAKWFSKVKETAPGYQEAYKNIHRFNEYIGKGPKK